MRALFGGEQALLIGLVLACAIGGKVGLLFAYEHPAVSLVWPASGIALGAFLVQGYRVWPPVMAGLSIAFASTIGLVPAALLLAGGATIEALLAAYLVNRYAGGRHALHNPRNSLRFAGVVLLACLTSGASVGTVSLVATSQAVWTDYGALWVTLSLGSLVGMLLVAPPILLASQSASRRWRRAHDAVEAVAVLLAVLVLGMVVFFGFPPVLRPFPLEFLCVPILLWAAFRLGRQSAAAALILLAVLATLGTLSGHGPFVRNTPTASLVVVQLFIGVTVVMTLSIAALASEHSAAEEHWREMVVTDPLTGLPNYRKLIEVLGTEIERSDRTSRPFAVVFFDMDGLKRINDDFGHLVGSRAVCRFAEMLRAACRTTDTPARYGGDEFVAVLTDTDFEGAKLVIRRTVERLETDEDKPSLSVSAGIAIYPRDAGTPTTLLSAADRALYAVKAEKANARRRGVVGIREWTGASTG